MAQKLIMKIAAVIAVREDTAYLHNCLKYLQENAIKVLIIDDGLTTAGRRIVEAACFADTVVAIETLAASEVFDLEGQLVKKEKMIDAYACDWIMHQDIDEILQSNRQGESLRDAILRVDASGANAINFLEMVFIPHGCSYATAEDGWPEILSYYYFAPAPRRLMRARRKGARLSMLSSPGRAEHGGGHLLFGEDLALYEENFVLRHYIVMDQEHASRKYVERRFSEAELARGWHGNRVGFSPQDFVFPEASLLKWLPHRHSAAFDLSEPHQTHYWQWPSRTGAGG